MSAWHNLPERLETLLLNQEDTITELKLENEKLKVEIERLRKKEAEQV